jgi:hypothetical protein
MRCRDLDARTPMSSHHNLTLLLLILSYNHNDNTQSPMVQCCPTNTKTFISLLPVSNAQFSTRMFARAQRPCTQARTSAGVHLVSYVKHPFFLQ